MKKFLGFIISGTAVLMLVSCQSAKPSQTSQSQKVTTETTKESESEETTKYSETTAITEETSSETVEETESSVESVKGEDEYSEYPVYVFPEEENKTKETYESDDIVCQYAYGDILVTVNVTETENFGFIVPNIRCIQSEDEYDDNGELVWIIDDDKKLADACKAYGKENDVKIPAACTLQVVCNWANVRYYTIINLHDYYQSSEIYSSAATQARHLHKKK